VSISHLGVASSQNQSVSAEVTAAPGGANVPTAPDKRKGPCMARRGQVGTVEISGKWYVVRFWKYPAGQDRMYASQKICPTDCKALGYLPKGERRRRASEIVEANGVNDSEEFVASEGVTFREQAKWFLNYAVNRKRRPAKPATVSNWRYCVDKWLNPHIGELPLASINNSTVKALVAKMHDAKLSAQTMTTYVNLVKFVIGSAIDDNGEQLFPRKWNNDFIDLPVIENQKQPTFTPEVMTAIVQNATGQIQVLYALLAATGLRIGEALGLEVRHFSADFRTITVEQSCWQKSIQTPKTKSAYRQIDVCTAVATLLKQFIGKRQSGFLFANGAGKPLSQTNVVRRSLHPILEAHGVGKTGFHAMRRFRTTWLRKQRTPEDLIRFWLGHAKQSMTDGYSMLAQDVEFRQEVSEKLGTGFDVPASMTPTTPRKSAKKEREVASQVLVTV
jgi:integrase